MPLLRDRRQFIGDQRPVLAVVFAAIDFAAGGAAKDRAVAIGFFEAKRAELMLQARRQPAGEPLPVFSAVFTAIKFAFGARPRPGLAPGYGIVLGRRDKHRVGVFRIPDKAVGINIRRPVGRGPAFPAAAAGVTDIKAGAAGDVNSLRIARIDQTAVHVIKMFHRAVLVLV